MTYSRSIFAALLAGASLTACVGLDEETFGEATSQLSTAGWSTSIGNSWTDIGYPPVSANLDGHDYYVFTWNEGGSPIPSTPHDLYWFQCSATACTVPHRIPGQQTSDRVNLAAFNGYIYMVHVGESDSSALWFSRLDPATGQWTTNSLLSNTTFDGAPALAAFNNQLYMVGTSERTVFKHGIEVSTYPMWYATMDASETFSVQKPVGYESATRPSLAVFFGKLYLAHRNGATDLIAINTMAPGGSAWSPAAYVLAGPGGTRIQGDDVQIAETNGYLHLIHHRYTDNYTWWTYYDGCTWAPELTFDSYTWSSRSSMSTVNGGLGVARLHDIALWPYTSNAWENTTFTAPPAPITVPLCLPTQG
ncbi:MAG: hypothetical protein ABIY55_23410 [Kofleriaceae bacterium]